MGFSRAYDIRKLIERYAEELRRYGVLCQRGAEVVTSHGARAPTNEMRPETPEAEPAPRPDVRRIVLDLPLRAIGALRERGFLARGEDDDAAIGEAMMAMLDAAWLAGIRAEDAEVEERKWEFHARLAESARHRSSSRCP